MNSDFSARPNASAVHGPVAVRPSVTLIPRLHDTTGCQPAWHPCWTNSHCSFNQLSNRLNVCIHDTTGCQTGLTPVWQQVVSCKRGFTRRRGLNLLRNFWCRSLQWGLLPKYVKYNPLCLVPVLYCPFFSIQSPARTAWPIFTLYGSNDVVQPKEKERKGRVRVFI